MTAKYPLPEIAEQFLCTVQARGLRASLCLLYRWLLAHDLSLADLRPRHLNDFWKLQQERFARPTVYAYRCYIGKYLHWLRDQGMLHSGLFPLPPLQARQPLPQSAREFLDTLRPVCKHGTCSAYAGTLRGFYAWLDAQEVSLSALDRPDLQRWMNSLADRRLNPVTRHAHIIRLRCYLRWLAERGVLDADPDTLLRNSDLPKCPDCLPRPFPLDADREIQRRLETHDTLYGQALILMRRSGLRIGEILALEPGCLDYNLRGDTFLKVPLGKLDNERLVPLDDSTRKLVEMLHAQHRPDIPFLISPPRHRATIACRMRATLREAASGLGIPGRIVPHRLRHTYATELLNGGMSLVTLMKLLGHRSLHMTMGYAALIETEPNRHHSAWGILAG